MQQLRPLSSELAIKAKVELNENPTEIESYIQSLREWVVGQTYLKSRSSDQFLIVFLRSSKYSLEKAKQRLKDFYIYRSRMPDIFKNRNLDCPKLWTIVQSGCVLYLPEPIAADGPRVVLVRPQYFDMEKHSISDVFKVGSMATDLLLYEDDNAIVAGYEFILDLSNIPTAVVLNFDPIFMKKIIILANKISPSRMKGFHFLNVPPIFEKGFNMVKSVINAKLRNRFFIHGSDYEKLYERIPRRILPKEYGGECDIETLNIHWKQKFKAHKNFYAEEECYGVIREEIAEGCRSKSSREAQPSGDDIFGVNGSFRKLNLD